MITEQRGAEVGWSTRELAELAGTTVNTVRHYHRLGLLEEPSRRSNGYKQYDVGHLVRLLRIRRLVELGVPLAEVDTVGSRADLAPDVLRRVDAGLAEEVERLQGARATIAAILRDGAPADAPAGFEGVAARLSPADASMLHVYSQLYDEDAMADLRRMVEAGGGPVDDDIDALPPDADEATRQNLAEKLAPILAQHRADHPWLRDQEPHLSRGAGVTRETVVAAIAGLYNPAQRDVLARADALAQELLGPGGEG